MRGLNPSKPLFQSLQDGELKKLLDVVKNSEDYFLGIRDEYINIYFMGGSLLKISCTKTKTSKIKFEFNPKYNIDSKKSIPNTYDRVDDWIESLSTLKELVKSFQEQKNKNEKMAQQNLLINNNKNIDSDYYFTDMEYSCPGIGYGRFDYVALTKKRNQNGKFQLALVELKYGTGAFKTSGYKYGRYGSGIVGHAYNFSRFVFGVNDNNKFNRENIGKENLETLTFLRKETINILNNKMQLGLLDPNTCRIFSGIKEEDIDIEENSIETLLITLGCIDIERAKSSIRNYLGVTGKADPTVQKLIGENKISNKFKLKCLVTKDKGLNRLTEQQFENLDMSDEYVLS